MTSRDWRRGWVWFLFGALSLGLLGCGSWQGQREGASQVEAWLADHALAVESVAAHPDFAPHLEHRSFVSLPLEASTRDLLQHLDAERPDYVVTVPSVAWDGVLAQPWFLERYAPVGAWSDAADVGGPIRLFAYAPSPFDAGEWVDATGTFDTDVVMLRGYRVSSRRVTPGEPIYVTLFWDDVPGRSFAGYRAVVTLVGGTDGRVWARTGAALQAVGLTWQSETRLTQHVFLTPPTDLPEGLYRLVVTLCDSQPKPIPVRFDEDTSEPELVLTEVTHPPDVSAEPLSPDHDVGAHFGGVEGPIVLLGYDAAARAALGSPYRVALYWHALQAVEADYRVFVHLMPDAGTVAAQVDGDPVYGFYPTSSWEAGWYVRDEHVVALPEDLPRGDYAVSVGLYLPDAGERLPVYAGAADALSEQRVILHTLSVR